MPEERTENDEGVSSFEEEEFAVSLEVEIDDDCADGLADQLENIVRMIREGYTSGYGWSISHGS